MPTKAKIVLNIDLDSKIGKFVSWYEEQYTTVNENGRKRKGNAKAALLDFLTATIDTAGKGAYASGYRTYDREDGKPLHSIEKFEKDCEEYIEVGRLPNELKAAKKHLSPEEFETFQANWQKISSAEYLEKQNQKIIEEDKKQLVEKRKLEGN